MSTARWWAIALWVCPTLAWGQNSAINLPEETWAAEDVPGGDDDANDLVVRHTTRCEFGPGGDLSRVQIFMQAVADGASKANGLAIELPVAPTYAYDSFGPLPTDGEGRHVLWSDFAAAFPDAPPGFVNTEAGVPFAGGYKVIEFQFDPGYVPGGCPTPRFVLTRPTDGVAIDTSTAGPGNRPLAYRLPANWDVPLETVDLAVAYPQFLTWLQSVVGGCTPGVDCAAEGWFSAPSPTHTVDRPDIAASPLPVWPSCNDGFTNGDETDTDCGGTICPACTFTCAPTYGGHEVCDAWDNDCNGVTDDGCGTIDLSAYAPLATPGFFNGNFVTATPAGNLFIVEYPGNEDNPGTLHVVGPTGVVESYPNSLVNGAYSITTSPTGRVFVGGYNYPTSEVEVQELDPGTGASLGIVHHVPGSYIGAIAAGPDDVIYVGEQCCDGPIWQTTGPTTWTQWSMGVGNNTSLAFDATGTTLYVGHGGGLSATTQGAGASTPIRAFDGVVDGLFLDNGGQLLLNVVVMGFMPWEPSTSSVYRYDVATDTLVHIVDVAGFARAAYDPVADTLFLDVEGSVYRLPLDTAALP